MGPNVFGRSIRVCSRRFERLYGKDSVGQPVKARYAKNVSLTCFLGFTMPTCLPISTASEHMLYLLCYALHRYYFVLITFPSYFKAETAPSPV